MCCCSTEDVVPFRQAGSSIVVPSVCGASRLSTQDVGLLLHLLEENKKGPPASHTPFIPIIQQEQWCTSKHPSFFSQEPRLSVPTVLSSFEEAVPLFGRWAVPWLSPGGPCTPFTHLNTLLGNCLLQSSTELPPSALPGARSHCQSAVEGWRAGKMITTVGGDSLLWSLWKSGSYNLSPFHSLTSKAVEFVVAQQKKVTPGVKRRRPCCFIICGKGKRQRD